MCDDTSGFDSEQSELRRAGGHHCFEGEPGSSLSPKLGWHCLQIYLFLFSTLATWLLTFLLPRC